MNELRFAEPEWIHALWFVGSTLLGLIWLERRGGAAFDRFVGPALQKRMVSTTASWQRVLRLALLAVAAFLLVIGLMRPQWGFEFISAPRVGAEIMIALDVSKSMLAEDVAPNRLERAKAEIRDLLPYLDGDQVGLIAFAGRASVLCPLTPDFSFLRLVLDNVAPSSVSRGGTRLEEPIRKAVDGFGSEGDLSRVILLITDGEDHDSFPLDAAKRAAERGVRILAIGFGDEGGSEIVMTDPQSGARVTLRDADDRKIISRLDGDLLRELAVLTNGAYVPAGTGVLDLESIFEAHIRPLMRASGEERGETIQKDGFQWPILLAILALLGSVASQAVRTSSIVVFALALGGLAPDTGHAQTIAQSASDAAGRVEERDEGEAPIATEGIDRLDIPEDPRSSYNAGLESLAAGQLDDAERRFEAARYTAQQDGETRFRATYNQAWVEVRRSDAALASDPEQALTALDRAADWFREAIALRPRHEDSRHNLEVVLQRALVLSDSIAAESPRELDAQLAALIDEQRAGIVALRGLLGALRDRDDPNAADWLRPQFKAAAIEERGLLSRARVLVDLASDELTALENKAEEERSPEDQMRAAQLEGLLQHLHRARERMGQARSQLRQRRGERAYRRASGALSALKRAQEQLQDPVRVLDGLLGDANQLAVETGGLAASQIGIAAPGSVAAPPAPAWLTTRYLGQSQQDIRERTEELSARLEAGLAQGAGAQDPGEQQMLEQVASAGPFVLEAIGHFERASDQLEAEEIGEAHAAQRSALVALANARERFLDLRGLIELAHRDEGLIQGILSAEEGSTETLSEYASALSGFQRRNLERAERMAPLIVREREGLQAELAALEDPEAEGESQRQGLERLDVADTVLALTESAMRNAEEKLRMLADGDSDSDGDADSNSDAVEPVLATTRRQVDTAVRGLDTLRRLFFSMIEHLRDAARRQQGLIDGTEEAAGLAESAPQTSATRVGPLTIRQSDLAKLTEKLALELHESSLQDPGGMGGAADQDPVAAAEAAEKLTLASEHVLVASQAMAKAAEGLTAAGLAAGTPEFEPIQSEQRAALEGLAEALVLLQPPQQEQDQDGEQGQDPQQQDQQGQDSESGDQQSEQPEPSEGEAEQTGDPGQMLQSVRDREAERHRERGKRNQQGYEPVTEDW